MSDGPPAHAQLSVVLFASVMADGFYVGFQVSPTLVKAVLSTV